MALNMIMKELNMMTAKIFLLTSPTTKNFTYLMAEAMIQWVKALDEKAW